MILVDSALRRREADRNPIKVGLVGAGFQGRAVALQIVSFTPGMRLCAIANRTIAKAVRAYVEAGVEPTICDTPGELAAAIAAGIPAVTTDSVALAQVAGLDAILEVTGSLEHAAIVIQAAIKAGKHVIQMNAEVDATVGPILKRQADAAQVIYTFSDGDQPGVQMNLLRFVEGIGLRPVLCGSVKGFLDRYRTPATQAAYAAKWGLESAMAAAFADGTKISFEQAVVANGGAMRVARRGMLGPDFSGGDPDRPLVSLEEAVKVFEQHLTEAATCLVDYVVGAAPASGVFVLATTDDARQRHYLASYKVGDGPYYCFYTPYHLCHFEVPTSVARAVLFNDAVLAPRGGPCVGVVAVAKKDLTPGEQIEQLGGYEVYGVAENMDAIRRGNLLPLGLAIGRTVIRAVAKNEALTFEDVQATRRTIDMLYAEQENIFAPRSLFGRG